MSPAAEVAPQRRTIFAMGGGGFTMEPANPLLDDYVLSLARRPRPRLLFLPTASGDTTGQINAFYARFGGRSCEAQHLSLFRLAGLGLLQGSLTVHADGEPERLPVWLEAVRSGVLPGGWALDDGVGLLFRGERMARVVSSRPGAGAQRVDAIAGELVRQRLEPQLLGRGAMPPPLDEDVQELRRVQRLRARTPGRR